MNQRMTIEEYHAFQKKPVSNKYGNKKTVVDGIRFDSKKEANRYKDLRLMEKAGEIYDLKTQHEIVIYVNGTKVCVYVADFHYYNKGGMGVIEDVKSPATRRNPVYRLKKKLAKAALGIEIVEV